MTGKQLFAIRAKVNANPFGGRKFVGPDGLSKVEYQRRVFLKEQEELGVIANLKFQHPFRLVVNDVFICTYIADFVYSCDGVFIVEDAKAGSVTTIFKLKKKLMYAIFGIRVVEIRDPRTPIALDNSTQSMQNNRDE